VFYRAFRFVISILLRSFFRFDDIVDPARALATEGPVIFVGNHPNGLIDPGLLFIFVNRRVTFLAKAPLFRMPLLGALLRALEALPVYRKQDGVGDTSHNEGTLAASVSALVDGRAITLFPEGKSHSSPHLAELKTGCARIALDAAAKGAAVRIVPVGMTYAAKNRFRSLVHFEVGQPIAVAPFADHRGSQNADAVRELTETIAQALEAITLNLDQWEDLPLVETAEALYALEQNEPGRNVARTKAFARGMSLLRNEQPERFETLKAEFVSFRRRLDLLQVTPTELSFQYRPLTVASFVVRNLAWLAGFPVFLFGMLVFFIPYWIPIGVVRATKPDDDVESTVKVLTLLLVAPMWWGLLTCLGTWKGGLVAGVLIWLAVPPLAFFTRWYLERRGAAFRDIRVFLLFLSRRRLKTRLLEEGAQLSKAVAGLADELEARVVYKASGDTTNSR
jgi:1-acyl-sn-glycerol-3-phosphate acyltransferase